MIIFVGPQGTGKTTQAYLLLDLLKSKGLSGRVISFSQHALLQKLAGKFLVKISGSNAVRNKFHENLSAELSPSPEVYKKLHVFLIGLHVLNLAFVKVLTAFSQIFFNVVIDSEGYSIKQLADLHFDVLTRLESLSGKNLVIADRLLLSSFNPEKMSIIYFEGRPELLRSRYLSRKSGIEPSKYIFFQNCVFKKAVQSFEERGGVVVKLNAYKSIESVQADISASVSMLIT
jgi:thymidylate kinase